MPNNTTLTVRIDPVVKQQAQTILNDLGLDMTSAINVYLKKIIQCEGIPFELRREKLNEESLRVIEKTRRGEDTIGPFDTVEELMEALDAED